MREISRKLGTNMLRHRSLCGLRRNPTCGLRRMFAFGGTLRGVMGVVKDVHENKRVVGASVRAQLRKSVKRKELLGGVR